MCDRSPFDDDYVLTVKSHTLLYWGRVMGKSRNSCIITCEPACGYQFIGAELAEQREAGGSVPWSMCGRSGLRGNADGFGRFSVPVYWRAWSIVLNHQLAVVGD